MSRHTEHLRALSQSGERLRLSAQSIVTDNNVRIATILALVIAGQEPNYRATRCERISHLCRHLWDSRCSACRVSRMEIVLPADTREGKPGRVLAAVQVSRALARQRGG
jgi:hypothetical protein